ncbi:phage tail protein [Chitinophagaceae bacterium MMS25-I14]
MEGTLATISLFAGNFAPKNWAYCAGQIVAIQSNTALFSLLGTTYGGDGRVTFGLPDLRSRTALGAGAGAGLSQYVLGEMVGVENNTLLSINLPPHNHMPAVVNIQLPVNGDSANTDSPDGAYPATATDSIYTNAAGSSQYAGQLHTVAAIGMQGQNIAMNNLQPYLGMNYIICMYGVFPYRN